MERECTQATTTKCQVPPTALLKGQVPNSRNCAGHEGPVESVNKGAHGLEGRELHFGLRNGLISFKESLSLCVTRNKLLFLMFIQLVATNELPLSLASLQTKHHVSSTSSPALASSSFFWSCKADLSKILLRLSEREAG